MIPDPHASGDAIDDENLDDQQFGESPGPSLNQTAHIKLPGFGDSVEDIIMQDLESVTPGQMPSVAQGKLNDQGHHVDEFHGAARTFGLGNTYMDKFDMDRFAKERQTNLYYPFASKQDWDVAAFLLRSPLSMPEIDRFLSLELVCCPFYFNDDAHNLSDSKLETIVFQCKRTSQPSGNTPCRPPMEMYTLEDGIPYEDACPSVPS